MVLGRLNYLNPNIYYYVGKVYEYDMKHAYPSILKGTDFKFEDIELRNDIEKLDDYKDKKSLLIRIGKEIKYNKSIMEYINNKLLETIEKFQLSNNLTEDNIIAIKKDALFVTKECKLLEFGNILFTEKHNFDLYFYDYIKKFEYYIKRKYGILEFNIKGVGNEYDEELYGSICKLIYKSISNSDLSYIKEVQESFMLEKEKALDYCPSMLLYKDRVYLQKEKLIADNKLGDVNIKDIYFKHYASVCKSLINYLM